MYRCCSSISFYIRFAIVITKLLQRRRRTIIYCKTDRRTFQNSIFVGNKQVYTIYIIHYNPERIKQNPLCIQTVLQIIRPYNRYPAQYRRHQTMCAAHFQKVQSTVRNGFFFNFYTRQYCRRQSTLRTPINLFTIFYL